ncbi:MAG: phage protease, partial [Hyphomicrobium sp.]
MTKRTTTSQQAVVPGLGKRLALNLASGVLPEAGGTTSAPEWIEVLPAGPEIAGRDGRYWIADDPGRIVSDSLAGGPLHVDYEHASEVRAPQGEPAPAAGWIDKLETRDGGAIWAHVEWTPRARQMIADREYRFISPVFYFDKDSLRILSLVSVALTNKPNLTMTALNRRQGEAGPTLHNEERPRMDKEQLKALCRKLGLADEASPGASAAPAE